MSVKTFGIYEEGVLLTVNDFDMRKTLNFALSSKALKGSIDGLHALTDADPKLIEAVRSELGLKGHVKDDDGLTAIAEIVAGDILEGDFCEPETVFDTEYVGFIRLSDFDGEFTPREGDTESYDNNVVYLLNFHNRPRIWDMGCAVVCDKHPSTVATCATAIKRAGCQLLRNDIDWEKRLGFLSGSVFSS